MNIDWSIVLGVVGIVVSIGVGLGTFWVADRRTQRNRLLAARGLIVQVLSRSLGEGAVPGHGVIRAVIRSVIREQGMVYNEQITVAEVVDDLLRQVTSAPFLEAERRQSLQDELLQVAEGKGRASLNEAGVRISSDGDISVGEIIHYNTYSYSNSRLAANLLLGVASSITATAVLLSLNQGVVPKNLWEWFLENSEWMASGIAVFALALGSKLVSSLRASRRQSNATAEPTARADG